MAVFRGVYAIPPTPSHPSGGVDEPSLERCIAFCLEAGTQGLVTPVVASEASSLTTAERQRIADMTVGLSAGEVPVIIGVSAETQSESILLARHAARVGADAVIAMPPPDQTGSPGAIADYYSALAGAIAPLPVWIQHYLGPGGTVMPDTLLASLLRSIPGVSWLKEETARAPQAMTRIRKLAGSHLHGVMGGMGGRYLIDEAERGACSTMPACELVDGHVKVWNALAAGDIEQASRFHTRLLPLLNLEAMYGFPVWKEVLRRRGVIAHACLRTADAPSLDEGTHREIDRILSELGDLIG